MKTRVHGAFEQSYDSRIDGVLEVTAELRVLLGDPPDRIAQRSVHGPRAPPAAR
jgi:hypothetical protein